MTLTLGSYAAVMLLVGIAADLRRPNWLAELHEQLVEAKRGQA